MIELFFLGKKPEQEQRESFSGLSPDLDLAAVQKHYPSEVENKGFKGQVDQWMKKAHARPSLAFGVSRGIKESFFHGKPNQKGKALLMMGGVEVSMVGDEWRSRSRQSDINNHLPCVSRVSVGLFILNHSHFPSPIFLFKKKKGTEPRLMTKGGSET